jgi:hypothetical protein
VDYATYEKMVDKALHGVIHDILMHTAHHGLKDDQHFYITFLTAHPDVKIPQYLKEDYPDEITIVLQHQFDNLMVSKKQFAVDLYFDDILESIKVPFSAVISFLDPSVNWGLNFDPEISDFSKASTPDAHNESGDPELKKEKTGVVVSIDSFRKK